jgi:hypothetical protein
VLFARGNLSAALSAHRASLEVSERLANSDPGNAGWQRDLVASYHRLAIVCSQQRDEAAMVEYLRNCLAVLHGMMRQGMYLDPESAQLYKQLVSMFGGH